MPREAAGEELLTAGCCPGTMPGHSRMDSESMRSGPVDGGIPREAAGSDAGDAAATPTRVSDWVAASGLSAEQDEALGALQVRNTWRNSKAVQPAIFLNVGCPAAAGPA